MSGTGFVTNRRNRVSMRQWFDDGLYASDIETPLLAVDLITTHAVSAVTAAVSLASIGSAYIGAAQVSGALSAGSVSTASAALSIATIGGAYMASAQVSGALSAGSVSTAAAVVSLATLGATYATSLNIANPLAVGSGGTGLTTIPAGRIMYGNDTSAVSTSSNFVFDGNNLGIGTTPSAWGLFRALQIYDGSVAVTSGQIDFSVNSFYDGSNYRYINTGGSARYTQTTGGHYWILDASGAAGDLAPISYKMVLLGDNLGIGTTTPLSKLHVSGSIASFGANLGFTSVGVGTDFTNYEALQCAHDGVNGARFISSGIGTGTIRPFNWLTFDGSTITNIMTLTAAGYLGIGATTPSAALHVIKTTEQLRLGYDVSNYTALETDSGGNFIISPTGGGIRINQAPAGSAGAATGTYLTINLNGTNYKIALQANA